MSGQEQQRNETVSEQLWAAYRAAPRPKPCAKELMEAFAFLKKVEPLIFKRKRGSADKGGVDVALDVCGGHGVLALLLVIYRKARRAIILDIDTPRSFATMCTAWEKWLPRDHKGPGSAQAVECRHGDVHTTLPAALAELEGSRVAVCGIHACDFLTDLCMESAMAAAQNFAVMACCHVDRHKGQLKQAATSCQISVGQVLDIVRLGRAWDRGYMCHWRTIDRSITAQNRVLIGTAPDPEQAANPPTQVSMKERARLMERYHEYHKESSADSVSDSLECSADDDNGDDVNIRQANGAGRSSSEDEMPCGCIQCSRGSVSFNTVGSPRTQLLEEDSVDNSEEEEEEGQTVSGSLAQRAPRITLQGGPVEPEPQPDNLLSMMALSSDVMVSVHKPARAPVTSVRQVEPRLTPVEALSTLESAVSASLALDVEALSTDTDIASAKKQSDLSACIEELSQAIAGFVAHGSVGARLPRSAVVLGKAQSQLRALRKQAMARVALAELRAVKKREEAEATVLVTEAEGAVAASIVSSVAPSDGSASSRTNSPTSRSSVDTESQGPNPVHPDTSPDAMDGATMEHASKRALLHTPMVSIGEQQHAEGLASFKPTSASHGADGAEEDNEEKESDDRDRCEQDHSVSDDLALARADVSDWQGSSLDDKDGPEDSASDDAKAETALPSTPIRHTTEDPTKHLPPMPVTPSSVRKHHPAWRTHQSWSTGGSPAELKARARTGLDGIGPRLDSKN